MGLVEETLNFFVKSNLQERGPGVTENFTKSRPLENACRREAKAHSEDRRQDASERREMGHEGSNSRSHCWDKIRESPAFFPLLLEAAGQERQKLSEAPILGRAH